MRAYLLELALAFDHFLNAVLNGSRYESLSSRAYRMEVKDQPYWGHMAKAINRLFWWQANHCRGAHAREAQILALLKIGE